VGGQSRDSTKEKDLRWEIGVVEAHFHRGESNLCSMKEGEKGVLIRSFHPPTPKIGVKLDGLPGSARTIAVGTVSEKHC